LRAVFLGAQWDPKKELSKKLGSKNLVQLTLQELKTTSAISPSTISAKKLARDKKLARFFTRLV
jgi:hypothetical protein